MTGAEWIADKINSSDGPGSVTATVNGNDVVFLRREEMPNAYVGVVPSSLSRTTPVVSLDEVRAVHVQNSSMAMMISIPKVTRWSGPAIRWLQSERVAFGGVGDLMSAMRYDEDMSDHRNKTFAFVDDGLRRHSRVRDLEWVDSKKVMVQLDTGKSITVALDDAYDITLSVAREAARTLGEFDILLKINPNGSITSNGAEVVERLGFETLKWGELFGHLAKQR